MLSRSIALESASSEEHAPQAGAPLRDWYEVMERAETGEGWASWCERHGVYAALSRELLDAVSSALRRPAVEIGAGNGLLADALGIVATDAEPKSAGVRRMSAREALAELAPRNVLACFPPVDAGIERAVLDAACVEQYLYIGPCPPNGPGWTAETLTEVEDVLLTRLDYLADFTRVTHQRRASAVLLRRAYVAIAS